MKVIIAILAAFVSLPIWLYLLYQILEAVNASELMWFLYWIYVPVSFLVSALSTHYSNKT